MLKKLIITQPRYTYIYIYRYYTSEGKLLEKRQRNHSVETRETSNSRASKWEAILHDLNAKEWSFADLVKVVN